jgi:hypothetical protein
LTGLELQSFQKKEFSCSKKIAFASTISVLQDLGFTVNSANYDSGHLSAIGTDVASKSRSAIKSIPGTLLGGPLIGGLIFGGLTQRRETSEITVNIEEIGPSKTCVRLSFVPNTLKRQLYDDAFSRIRETVFIKTKN